MGNTALPNIVQNFKAGTRLVVENDTSSRKMFIIRSGKARVYKMYMNQRITLAILGEGEVFGEMSFFDAEARSASVEALTDLTAVVLDGEAVKREVAGLPDWIYPIFRTVFHRFREMDRRLTVFQSMNEFQKRTFKTDNVAKTIYLDMLRFLKTLKLLYERDLRMAGAVKSEKLYAELDSMLGTRSLGLRVFWRMLKEFDFIDHEKEESEGVVVLNEDAIRNLNDYLVSEVETERYLLVSHSAVAVLGKIVGFTRAYEDPNEEAELTTVKFNDIALNRLPLHEEAVEELKTRRLLRVENESFIVQPGQMYHLYMHQSILKAFDHTIINMD
jgi:CRP/FNR family cyclic AMP-dependent transcriptional regulator